MIQPTIVSALPTPFTRAGSLDLEAFTELVCHVGSTVDAVLVAGTTGEFPALSDEERVSLFEVALNCLGSDKVIAHIGHQSPRQVKSLLDACPNEIRYFAAISPLFFRVGENSTTSFYREIANHLGEDQGLYAYLFPERTGNDTSLSAAQEILALDRVVGIKLSGAANKLFKALTGTGGRKVMTGNDAMLRQVFDSGATGIVSGCSAARPEPFVRLARALADGATDVASEAENEVAGIVSTLGPSILALKLDISRQTGREWHSRMCMD